jgi:hypothetical protein
MTDIISSAAFSGTPNIAKWSAPKLHTFSSAPAFSEPLLRCRGTPILAALNGKILSISVSFFKFLLVRFGTKMRKQNLDKVPLTFQSFEAQPKKRSFPCDSSINSAFPDSLPSYMIDSQDLVWQAAAWVRNTTKKLAVLYAGDSLGSLWRFSVSLESGQIEQHQMTVSDAEQHGILSIAATSVSTSESYIAMGGRGVLWLLKHSSDGVTEMNRMLDSTRWFTALEWHGDILAVGSNARLGLYRLENSAALSLSLFSNWSHPTTLACAHSLHWNSNGDQLAVAFGIQVIVFQTASKDLNAHPVITLSDPIRLPVASLRWMLNDKSLYGACTDGLLFEWRVSAHSLRNSDVGALVIDCGHGPYFGLEVSPYSYFILGLSVAEVKAVRM